MKTISADFNAMTESEELRLGFRSAQEDIQQTGAKPGDWVWLSDGEIVVGGQLKVDGHYGLVGVPQWTTLVHLDEEETPSPAELLAQLRDEREIREFTPETGARLLALLTLLDETAPAEIKAKMPPGWLLRKRAVALTLLEQPGMALSEIEEALRQAPDDPHSTAIYLDLLRVHDLPRAVREAERLAVRDPADAMVLSACINILAAHADDRPDTELPAISSRLRDWLGRFEAAARRDLVPASTLALVYFDLGQIALRQGDVEEASRYLQLATRANPLDRNIARAADLDTFNQEAKDLVRLVHARRPAA